MIIFIYFNKSLLLNEWPLIHEDMHQLVAHVTELVFQLSLIEMHPSLFLRFCLPISVSSCLTILSLVLIPSNTNFSKESSLFMWPKDHNRWCSHLDHHCGHSRSLWRHPPPSKPMHNCSVIFNIRDWMLWFTVFVSHWYNILQACKIHMRIQDYSFVVFSCWYELPSDLLSTLPILRYLGALLKYNVLFKIFVILQIFTIDLNM